MQGRKQKKFNKNENDIVMQFFQDDHWLFYNKYNLLKHSLHYIRLLQF